MKKFRVIVGLLFFLSLTLALVDAYHVVPNILPHWVASFQVVPVLLHIGSSFVPASILLFILSITFLYGRVYCSTICPLGVWQDIVARVANWFRKKPLLLRFAPAWDKTRYAILAVVGIVAIIGGASFVLEWLDPYSNYGRIASGIFRPLGYAVHNGLAWGLTKAGVVGVEVKEFHDALSWGAIAAFVPLLVVTTLAATNGRLYCNTICPVGTLLGLVSRKSRYRLIIDQGACARCAECLRSCKTQSIDLKQGVVDMSRCVGCFNCIAECDQSAISYRRVKEDGSSDTAARNTAKTVSSHTDTQRRSFVLRLASGAMAFAGASLLARSDVSNGEDEAQWKHSSSTSVVLPPGGGSKEKFLSKCTACHLCISACPTHVLRPAILQYGIAGFLKPRLDYGEGYCSYDCKSCGAVCPNGAIEELDLERKRKTRIGNAFINLSFCMVAKDGVDCWLCAQHCPVGAIPHGENDTVPKVIASLCIGCGACECHCPVEPKAATVKGASLQTHLVKPSHFGNLL